MGYENDYGADYYESHLGLNDYIHNEGIICFNRRMAEGLVNLLHPATVLDVGCACGHLVSAFRDNGVEAYGIDSSSYALDHVRAEHRGFVCRAALPDISLPDSFPKKYDLVTFIEVIEHIREIHNHEAITALSRFSDTVLFSSTPDDFDEPTHINVHPISFWCAEFAKAGFYPDMTADLSFGAPQFVLFRKRPCCPGMEELFRPLDVLYQEKTTLTKLALERLRMYREASDLAQERLRLYQEARAKLDEMERVLDTFGIRCLYGAAKSAKRLFVRLSGKGTDSQGTEGDDRNPPRD
ncbi:MAG: class I SAM-dependent methyltransferase [Lentisphaeria bacterium]|nr:class I SAM-dependent methyltransferase [Lentisphaeria bacterium]